MEKVRELDSQKQQTEKAFHGFLPPSLVRDMKRDQVTHREESVNTFVTVMCSKHWRSLSVSRYSSEKF